MRENQIVEMIQEMKIKQKTINLERADDQSYIEGEEYNEACDDIINKIKGV